MATIKEVAKLAGVGVGTVSRVINKSGSVSKENYEKVVNAIESIGFIPNQIARNFKTQRTNSVALLLPTICHPFFSKLAYYIEKYFAEKGSKLIIVDTQGYKEKEIRMLNMTKANQVDGIIFVTQHTHENIPENIPLVSIDAHISESVPFITSENYQGTLSALEYMYATGSRKIGCICGMPTVKSEVEKRIDAYNDFVKKYELESRLFVSNFGHGEELNVVTEFLDKNEDIDGLFLGSDQLANCAYSVLLERGKNMPEDIQIFGFDGALSDWVSYPKISTVVQNIKEIALEVSKLLNNRIEKKPFVKQKIIPVKMFFGSTTR